MSSDRWKGGALTAVALLVVMAVASCQADRSTSPLATDQGALLAKGGIPGPPSGGGGRGGGGGGDEGFGNNLSNPVILANGVGLGGLPVLSGTDKIFENTGFRPTTLDVDALAELNAKADPKLPFWWSQNDPEDLTVDDVYWQKTANVWQADWEARTAPTVTSVTVGWGDNLNSVNFTVFSVIRVEHVLTLTDAAYQLQGFAMDTTVNPSSPNEEQGIYADGSEMQTAALAPTVFTDRARLKLQKLDGPGGNVTQTYFNKAVYESFGVDGPGAYSAEINVGGRLLYGYVWNLKNVVMDGGLTKDGYWRITFSLDAGSGVSLGALGGAGAALNATLTPTETSAEIYIGASRGTGGGGRSGDGGS